MQTRRKAEFADDTVVSIENLTIPLPAGADRLFAVEGVSFSLRPGEVLCVVGESGSGKSMSASAMMGLLPEGMKPLRGRILLNGTDLLTLSEEAMRDLRGRRIGVVFQEPMSALNPLMRIGDQIAEVFEAHHQLTTAGRRSRALELLAEVGLADVERVARSFPFQLSGGQRQRVVIAMALALEPKVLIADEPTTALDVMTQAQILALIRRLQGKRNMAVMFITHDFGVVAEIADRVIVMQHGRIVEEGPASSVLQRPRHDYTRALIAAIPYGQVTPSVAAEPRPILLRVEALAKSYTLRGRPFRPSRRVEALSGVGFDLARGETLGIVGESGSGKSTLGKCLVRLQMPDAGRILLDGQDIMSLGGDDLRIARRRLQMVFQDPYASLNPRMTVGHIIASGPIAHGDAPATAFARACELLEMVGLGGGAAQRYPHEFSGGQRQRIGIARALALQPDIIVADEAVSALDVSMQKQVLDLFQRLKAELDLSLVFITHDLRVAGQICDRVMVMHKGHCVEAGSASQVLASPDHPYTRSLVEAIPGRHLAVSAP